MNVDEDALETLHLGGQEVHEVPDPLFLSRIIRIGLGTAYDSDMELMETVTVRVIRHVLQDCLASSMWVGDFESTLKIIRRSPFQ